MKITKLWHEEFGLEFDKAADGVWITIRAGGLTGCAMLTREQAETLRSELAAAIAEHDMLVADKEIERQFKQDEIRLIDNPIAEYAAEKGRL